jgi:hypothetical protein
MLKTVRHVALFLTVFLLLFGSLVLLSLAGEPDASLSLTDPISSLETYSTINTINFSPVATTYFPIVYRTP